MSAAKVRVLVLALGAGALASLLSAQPFPPPIASYQITCRLDPEKKTLDANEVLTWKNATSRPAPTLRLHLYLNAFRNTLSTFWRESGGDAREGKLPDSWGSIEITRMTGPDGADLLPAMRFIAPDDGNPDDRTVAEVILPRPVAPGETISVALDFAARLPRVSVRTGYKDEFFMVVQWFPKVGVLQENGWNCHQFHAWSEFFSDFGNYDVSIDVPARYKGRVGATGQRVEERETSAGRVLYRFKQDAVHDFAWTADPSYVVLEDTFREAGLGDVRLFLYLQPEHGAQAARYFGAVKAALSGYGRVLGAYPYPTLSIVDPPWGARAAGGMEYPTLITGGTPWSAPKSILRPEAVTVHEAGHQFFYGLLASNEFEEAWLDEGFNTYMTDRVLRATYGSNRVDLDVFGLHFPLGIEIHYPLDANRRYFEVATWDVLATPSWKFRSRVSYGANVYSKTALTLATLERLLGTPAMDKALRLYADRWRFRHPTTRDFMAAVNDATGADWTWFFDRTFFSSGVVDYAVAEAKTTPAKPPRGLFERDGKLVPDPPPALAKARGWNSTVLVVNRGDVALPVDVLLRFENGHVYRSRWDGAGRWKRFRVAAGPKLLEAVVDPDEKILLDVDRTNNGLRPQEDADLRAATRWTARAVFWVQNMIDFMTVAW
ncbi:MAG TPA: M1 family metallopeptidase [Thermoanaerobaculia bacterium]|nr:M1 family metallopeptidase [Thermoanaerobaculia bacterium]